ncbi:M12 family metallo-peptidase [Nocardioides sp.]|uniref:M12 family metallo-peptidase n=1 Tax=Nocardioides sp. TaxID=35761 RepID=UPI003784F6AC
MSRPLRLFAALAAAALGAAVLPAGMSATAAPPDHGIYRPAGGFKPSGPHVRVAPKHYTAFRVHPGQVRAALAGAPAAGSQRTAAITLPTPTGGIEHFAVQRTQLMQPKLAAAHPEISTWAGFSTDHRGTSVALDVTPMGLHASVRPGDGQGAWYVDPAYNTRGTTTHLSYYGGALQQQTKQFVEREMPAVKKAIAHRSSARAASTATVTQKTYRLALITDPTYASYFGAANVTSEKVTLLNRVNQIYNDDLAINLQLVNDNDRLNLNTWDEATGPNGPCGEHACYVDDPDSDGYVQGQIAYCDVGTLERNQIVLGQLVGASNYDIGHLMLGVNGGGIAGLGVVGGIEKGMGCTGLPDPTGDFMAIDYVAHEMGHQFGGNHTFNGTRWNCSGGNRNAGTSVEPGSGTSVMAYAGICRQDNLQSHSDPYFSQRTQTEANRYTGSPGAPPVEVQDVSLMGFDTDGDTLTIGYPGTDQTFTLERGGSGETAYTNANVEHAVETLTGEDVTVAGWGYDPYSEIYNDPPNNHYPAPLTTVDDGGFQVMFAGDADPYTSDSDRQAMHNIKVTPSDGVTAHVGETAKGGPADNQGRHSRTGNHSPVVRAPADRTIPTRTPFILTGSGTDPDGDPLVYLWEQNDDSRGLNGTALIDNYKDYGPLFRVFGKAANVSDSGTLEYNSPGENLATEGSRSRTFPDLRQVLDGNTNAKTGSCPHVDTVIDPYVPVPDDAVDCYSEFLPTKNYHGTPGMTNRVMHFRLTARDQVPGGGGVGYDQVNLRVNPKAGPFLVTTFGKPGVTATGGAKRKIAWQVNGTQQMAPTVKILLSTDNGRRWTVIKKMTPNDGATKVKIPRTRTNQARIMIRARGNYFFDVNDVAFSIR